MRLVYIFAILERASSLTTDAQDRLRDLPREIAIGNGPAENLSLQNAAFADERVRQMRRDLTTTC